MTLSGLVAFWALMITAYSVLPEYWKFKLKAFVGLIPTVVAFLTSSALVSYSMMIGERGPTIAMQGREFTIFPMWLQIAAYIVLFLYVLWLVRQLRKSKVTAGNLLRFQQLLSSLATNKQFDLIATVLKDNARRLAQIYDHKPIWHCIIKTRKETKDTTLPPALRPGPTELQNRVSEVFAQTISERELTEYLVEHDVSVPLLIVQVAEDKVSTFDLENYLHFVLGLLISNPTSELCRQIEQHQNIDWTGRRDFQSSQLLKFLFEDAHMAEKHTIWKPVGDYVLRYLQGQSGSIDDEYNRVTSYEAIKRERFTDPVFVGLEYFDFMIKEALIQKLEYHMWLYYLRYWTEQIVSKLEYDPDEWQRGYREFPTRYTFLLYEIIHYQLGWFDFAFDNKLDIKIKQMKSDEKSSILRCAAQCPANSLCLICESDQLPDSYKSSLTKPWWDTYFKLKSYYSGKYSEHAASFLEIMINEVAGDIFKGAFRSSLSLPLLGSITGGLNDVDIALEYVDSVTYNDIATKMKQLAQKYGYMP